MTTPAASSSGRRDRKKVETLQALRAAAHQLFAAKGYEATTIDDITEAADVSRRTFFRYFSSKEDLLRLDIADLMPAMSAALRARPIGEAPMLSIFEAIGGLIGPEGPPDLATSLAGRSTGIRARVGLLRLLAQWEQGIAEVLLERWASPPGSDRDERADSDPQSLRDRATVTAAAATSALRSSVQIYRARYPADDGLAPEKIVAIAERAFRLLADGFPAP